MAPSPLITKSFINCHTVSPSCKREAASYSVRPILNSSDPYINMAAGHTSSKSIQFRTPHVPKKYKKLTLPYNPIWSASRNRFGAHAAIFKKTLVFIFCFIAARHIWKKCFQPNGFGYFCWVHSALCAVRAAERVRV